MPRVNDSPAASMAFWLTSEIMLASATTVTSGGHERLDRRQHGLVSALLPWKAETISGSRVPPPRVDHEDIVGVVARRQVRAETNATFASGCCLNLVRECPKAVIRSEFSLK